MISDGDYKLRLGASAIDFSLQGVDGKEYALSTFKDRKLLVVIFSCNHCPYVQSYEERMIAAAKEYSGKGVAFVAINSNDDEAYPEDSMDEMKARAKRLGFPFPYLRDSTQSVGRAYGAVCTPHFLVYDDHRKLRYQGRFDDDRNGDKITSHDLRNALDALLAGRPVPTPLTLAFGCSIKWKAA